VKIGENETLAESGNLVTRMAYRKYRNVSAGGVKMMKINKRNLFRNSASK
jgi:hypothetical protein